MKIIIPAKKNSNRVPNKNWRPFYEDKNLVEIKIEQILRCVNPKDVFLSTDFLEMEQLANHYNINFLLRNPIYSSDETPWPDALLGIIKNTPFVENEDIAWVEVINPLFDDYIALFEKWQLVKENYDSIVLVSPINKFLLHSDGRPVNFQFGKWHAMSQNLDPLYAWDSACIMQKKNLLYFSYPIGKKPFLFSTGNQCIDIDTFDDFELAQYYYSKKIKNENK